MKPIYLGNRTKKNNFLICYSEKRRLFVVYNIPLKRTLSSMEDCMKSVQNSEPLIMVTLGSIKRLIKGHTVSAISQHPKIADAFENLWRFPEYI